MNESSSSGEYVFTCPECTERIRVDDDVKRLVLENGCVVCGVDVSHADFERCE